MKKSKTIADHLISAPKGVEVPHYVRRFLGPQGRFDFAGDQVSLAEDFGTLTEWRRAIEWLVEQFNGSVSWGDE